MEEGRDYTPEEVDAMFASQEGSTHDAHIEEEATQSKKGNKKVSFVWNYFVKVQDANDPRSCRCVCTVCRDVKKVHKDFAWKVGSGLGSMSRHLNSEHGITGSGVASQTQTQLSGFMSKEAGGGL
ncbi:uncharacterized protein LOC141640612 [Silene latifolia]|uniref:uncharacterized protein LOC141640612 n=1 Tax=Silene latifolia TaxID=37657 RepID=UPI003D7726A1